MIACLIGADWGEHGARGGRKTVKEDKLLMIKKIGRGEVGELSET